jgi:hypothetical protein
VNYADLRATVARRLSETASSPVFWSDDDIRRAVNNGYIEMSDSSEFFERRVVCPLIAGHTYYDMRTVAGEGFLTPSRVWSEPASRWAEPIDARTLDAQYGMRWHRVLGSPRFVLTRGLWWLGFYPTPASDTERAVVYGAFLPPRLLDDTDEPLFEEEFHEGIVHYALYELYVQDRETLLALRNWKEYLDYSNRLGAHVEQRIMTDRAWQVIDRLPGEELPR